MENKDVFETKIKSEGLGVTIPYKEYVELMYDSAKVSVYQEFLDHVNKEYELLMKAINYKNAIIEDLLKELTELRGKNEKETN